MRLSPRKGVGRTNQRSGLFAIILVIVVLLLSSSPLFGFEDSRVSGEQVQSVSSRGQSEDVWLELELLSWDSNESSEWDIGVTDNCSNSKQGIITDENGCEVIIVSGSESIDYDMVGVGCIFISIVALLLAFLKYSRGNAEIWMGLAMFSLLVVIFLPIAPIESNVEAIPGHSWILEQACDLGGGEGCVDDDGDNIQAQYRNGLLMCFFIGVFGTILGGVIGVYGGTPGAVIGGLFVFVSLTGGIFMWIWGTVVLGLFEIGAGNPYWIIDASIFIVSSVASLRAVAIETATFVPASVSAPASAAQIAQWKSNRQPVKAQHNPSVKGKIDHDQIRRLIHKYSSNEDVFKHYSHTSYPPAEDILVRHAIRRKRRENKQGSNGARGKGLAKPRANMIAHPSLASQGSSGSSLPEIISSIKSGVVANDSRIGRVDTDLLGDNESIKPSKSKPISTTGDSWVTVITTSFSVVTINKILQSVVKVPTSEKHNQMFINEINIMKSLDSKGIDVGLLESDEGENPRIVIRYFGSHKLGDGIKSMNAKGKFNIISELIKRIGEIHSVGWIHRDLKPDNLLIDSRPKGDHLLKAIIDFGIAMKIQRKQSEIHNTAATKFFGHSSQKDVNFNASTGQDWFSLARIFALVLRGTSVDSLNAEIQMSQSGLDMRNEIQALGFNDKVVDSMTKLIIQSTKPSCEQHETVKILEKIGKNIVKDL